MAEIDFNVQGGAGDERGRVFDQLNANIRQLNRNLGAGRTTKRIGASEGGCEFASRSRAESHLRRHG